IGTLHTTIQDTQLQSDSLAVASHVVDPAAAVPPGGLKHRVLGVMSGLILGFGLGVGIVFAHALVSNRLRRREEIATALGHAVPFSAGAVRGRFGWGAPALLPSTRKRRLRNLDVLVQGLTAALPADRDARTRLALVGVGDLRSAASVVMATASRFQEQGERV